jgi:predicted DNA-binding transcriptional regulator YafY
MSNSKQTTEKPASEQAALKALAANPEATAAEVAAAANVGRSTASKVLARLTSSGEVRRIEGGRDGPRRLPDRFALASAEPAADDGKPKAAADAEPKAADDGKPKAAQDAKPKAAGEHLKPGQLDKLVLAYLKDNADSGPHGPTTVAKALVRSSGAVGNCLVRLTNAKQVRQDSEKPRRYSLAA